MFQPSTNHYSLQSIDYKSTLRKHRLKFRTLRPVAYLGDEKFDLAEAFAGEMINALGESQALGPAESQGKGIAVGISSAVSELFCTTQMQDNGVCSGAKLEVMAFKWSEGAVFDGL